MTTKSISSLTLSLLSAAALNATVLEDFSGYKPGDTFSTGQTLGDAGLGWTSGWRTNSSYIKSVAHVGAENPLHDGPFLEINFSSEAGQPQKPSGAVARSYQAPIPPYTLSFHYRPAVSDDGIRCFIFESDTRMAGPAGTATWQIESKLGTWHLINGESDGYAAEVIDTGLPVSAGVTYAFTLAIDPSRKLWSATISDGKQTVARQDIRFRTDTVTPERWVHFGANEIAAPGQGRDIGCAVDTILIQP